MFNSNHIRKALCLWTETVRRKQCENEDFQMLVDPILVADRMPDRKTTLLALLHPVIESGVYAIADLEGMGFPDDVLRGLKVICRDDSVSNKDYLQNIKTCPIAMTVRLAELRQRREFLGVDDDNFWRSYDEQTELEKQFSVPFRMRTDEEKAKSKILRNQKWKDQIRGCIIGSAVGDALGYPVINNTLQEITSTWGEVGLTSYALNNGKAQISSTSQMAMMTAHGLLRGWTNFKMKGFNAIEEDYIYASYQEWLALQCGKKSLPISWLGRIPEMRQMRMPDQETMKALESGRCGSLDRIYNAHQGAGGLVRVAPVALFYKNDDLKQDCVKFVMKMGASVASITHGDPLGYLPAAMLTHILSRLIFGGSTTGETLNSLIRETKRYVFELFGDSEQLRQLFATVDKSLALATDDVFCDADNIARIGMGWRADEILGIALYCCIKYPVDFDKGIIAAANHDGDSSASAAVTGAVLGAMVGCENIDQKWKSPLELHNVLLELADDLTDECQLSKNSTYEDARWRSKYIECDFTL